MSQVLWQDRVRTKRAQLYNSIPIQWRLATPAPSTQYPRNVTQMPREFLSELEIAITESRPIDILNQIHSRALSAEIVVGAFCHRAAITHQLVNCLTEFFFEDALMQARQLDQQFLMTGKLKGALHGLPVSFMDRFRVAGTQTAAGYVGWLGPTETPETESLIVKQMRSLGAVPFCKTNVPMSMMLAETTNNITGNTVNPFVRFLSSGGAAGGEGALLAMRASPLGWASEVAGSSRIPAAFNRLYTLKPSKGRLPTRGMASSASSIPICEAVISPLSTDLQFLGYVVQKVVECQTYWDDISLIQIPWRVDTLRQQAPNFAILHNDQQVMPHPPVGRALSMTVNALRNQGFEIIEWCPPPHAPAVQTLFEILGADGANGVREAIRSSGEPPVAQLQKWYYEQDTGSSSTADFAKLCKRLQEYQQQYQDYWYSTRMLTPNGKPVDGVIMPVAPSAAAQRNKITYFGYNAIVNMLDYPAGTFPVTFANRDVDVKQGEYNAMNEEDKTVWENYDADVFHGAPVGLQVMCRRHEEEKVLELMAVIADALEACRY